MRRKEGFVFLFCFGGLFVFWSFDSVYAALAIQEFYISVWPWIYKDPLVSASLVPALRCTTPCPARKRFFTIPKLVETYNSKAVPQSSSSPCVSCLHLENPGFNITVLTVSYNLGSTLCWASITINSSCLCRVYGCIWALFVSSEYTIDIQWVSGLFSSWNFFPGLLYSVVHSWHTWCWWSPKGRTTPESILGEVQLPSLTLIAHSHPL